MGRIARLLVLSAMALALGAGPALASTLARVTAITGSAVVMRGNKVEKLTVGSKIEDGDRVTVLAGGRVTLSNGVVLAPGTAAVAKSKSGKIEIVAATTSSKSSESSKSSNKSKLFKDYDRKKDNDDDHDDDEDDDDDDDEDEDDEDEYGNPKDHHGASN